MVFHEYRSNGRREIVLAIGQRLIGYVAAARATTTLSNVDGPAALTLAARDPGSEGNLLRVEAISLDGASDKLNVYENSLLVSTFKYLDGDTAGLAEQINAQPDGELFGQALAETVALAPTGIVALTGGRNENPGQRWYKLNLPLRPYGQTGWVRAASVAVRALAKRVVVDRSARALSVFNGSDRIFRTRVAVGRPDRPTPLGRFYVRSKFVPPRTAFVSTYAFELSAPAGLSDFPGGGVIGIHGTPAQWSIGLAASNGCVRVPNWAARRLRDIVPLGTPVAVVR